MALNYGDDSRFDNNIDTGDEYIYYNFNLVNNNPFAIQASFDDVLNNAIITNGREYYLSVVRFVLDGSTIPVMFFTLQQNMVITLVDQGGSAFSANVNYIPNINQRDDLYNGLQTIYSYTQFVDMINAALYAAYKTLYTATGGAGGNYAHLLPPFLYYNPNNGRFQFFVDLGSQQDPTNSNTKGVRYFFNSALYEKFDNFQNTIYYQNPPFTASTNYELQFPPVNAAPVGPSTVNNPMFWMNISPNNPAPLNQGCNSAVPVNYYLIDQEYANTYLLFDVTTIKFRSVTIGVASEYTPIINTSDAQIQANNSGNGPPSSTMITDFQPYFAPGDLAGPRGYQYFAVAGEWRMLPMEKDIINKLDLDIVLVTRQGIEIPYFLPVSQSVQVKIAFVKKSCHGKPT